MRRLPPAFGKITPEVCRSSLMPIWSSLKAWLKPVVVSGWNAAHHAGWLTFDYAGSIASGRFARCKVCGRFRPLIYRRRIIPRRLEELWGLSPKLAEAFARKESCDLLPLRGYAPRPPDRAGRRRAFSGRQPPCPGALARRVGPCTGSPRAQDR